MSFRMFLKVPLIPLPGQKVQRPMRLFLTTPETYLFQDLDLSNIQKIIKCETSTAGA